jgi:hypothetical protein
VRQAAWRYRPLAWRNYTFAVIITNVPAEITFPIGMFLLLNPAVIPAAREVCLALPPIPNPRFCLFSLPSALSSPVLHVICQHRALRLACQKHLERRALDPHRHWAIDHQSSFCIVSGACQHYRWSMASLFLRIEADRYHVPGVRMYWRAITKPRCRIAHQRQFRDERSSS